MYVCICNGLNESMVRGAIEQRAASADEVFKVLGAEPCCRRCVGQIKSMVAENRASLVASASVMASAAAAAAAEHDGGCAGCPNRGASGRGRACCAGNDNALEGAPPRRYPVAP